MATHNQNERTTSSYKRLFTQKIRVHPHPQFLQICQESHHNQNGENDRETCHHRELHSQLRVVRKHVTRLEAVAPGRRRTIRTDSRSFVAGPCWRLCSEYTFIHRVVRSDVPISWWVFGPGSIDVSWEGQNSPGTKPRAPSIVVGQGEGGEVYFIELLEFWERGKKLWW